MFVRWKSRPLIETAYRRDVACAHVGKGRETWTPVVVTVGRVAGLGPRQTTVWRPARGIRSCCAEDARDPIARTRWWLELRLRCTELKDGTVPNRYRPQLVAGLKEILGEVEARVPPPTEADIAVATAWDELVNFESRSVDPYVRHRARLDEAILWVLLKHVVREGARRVRSPSAPVLTPVARRAFRMLGIRWPCSEQDIVRAYRSGVFRRHPDKGGDAKEFTAWTEAYEEAMTFYRAHGLPGARASTG